MDGSGSGCWEVLLEWRKDRRILVFDRRWRMRSDDCVKEEDNQLPSFLLLILLFHSDFPCRHPVSFRRFLHDLKFDGQLVNPKLNHCGHYCCDYCYQRGLSKKKKEKVKEEVKIVLTNSNLHE